MFNSEKISSQRYKINLGKLSFIGKNKKEAEAELKNNLEWYFKEESENIIQYLNENKNIIQLALLNKNINGYIMNILIKDKITNKQTERAYNNIGYVNHEEAIRNFVSYCNQYNDLMQESI